MQGLRDCQVHVVIRSQTCTAVEMTYLHSFFSKSVSPNFNLVH